MGLFSQNTEGPHSQACAVRAYLDGYDGVEASWDAAHWSYQRVDIAEWHNGREHGFVLMFRNKKHEQLNIAFFENRNSDEICALEWVQNTLNPPTIDTAKFGNIYKDKYDVSHRVEVGQASAMAEWIMDRLTSHWGLA